MRTVYIKDGDWQSVFNNLKLQAFSAGLVEFSKFLNTASVDQHGRIKSDMNDKLIDLLISDKKSEYLALEKHTKIIVKQARELGLKAAYNSLDRLHLRDLF